MSILPSSAECIKQSTVCRAATRTSEHSDKCVPILTQQQHDCVYILFFLRCKSFSISSPSINNHRKAKSATYQRAAGVFLRESLCPTSTLFTQLLSCVALDLYLYTCIKQKLINLCRANKSFQIMCSLCTYAL